MVKSSCAFDYLTLAEDSKLSSAELKECEANDVAFAYFWECYQYLTGCEQLWERVEVE